MTADALHGARIAILGSGLEGLAAFAYLNKTGTAESLEIITEAASGGEREAELQARGLMRVCPFAEAGLSDYDVLVRSPGVSPYRESLRAAAEAGVRIVSPSSIWFGAHPEAKTIVISGTKGKSTTAALLTHMMKLQGLKVNLAGNIGTPLLACEDGGLDWWVIELSSFQLSDLEANPTIGVLLNLAIDHLDWHGGLDRYRHDKLRLADLVEPGGLLANGSDTVLREALAGRDGIAWFSEEPDKVKGADAPHFEMPLSLPGRHNRANLAACLAVADKLGLDGDKAIAALASFKGLPHRFQRLGSIEGIEFIDDSISSAPMATVAALAALEARTVILLAGGFERGIDWGPYAEAMRAHPPDAVVVLPDNGPHILAALNNAGIEPELGTYTADNLVGAVGQAKRIAPKGAVVLLSPGAPSFPHFQDYDDRGRQFAKLSGLA